MSQRNPKLIDLDFAAPKDRRPGGNSNEGGSTAEPGAANDIRSLMDQLQQTAYEARHRLREVEDERDSLTEQVEALQQQSRELRLRSGDPSVLNQQLELLEQQKAELEKQLVQVRAQAAEREAALREAPQSAAPAAESEGRAATAEQALKEARRQQEDLLRQRDEMQKKVDLLNRSVQDMNQRVVASTQQVESLRLARDGAQNQNRELAKKMEQLEDELAEAQYQLEKQTEARAVAVTGEAPANFSTEMGELTRRLEEAESEVTDLRAQLAAVPDHEKAELLPGEFQEMAAARDAALAEAVALRAQIDRLLTDQPGNSGGETAEALRQERDSALVQVQMATKEVMELRAQAQGHAAQIEHIERNHEAVAKSAKETMDRFCVLIEERDAATKVRDDTLKSLASAQKQIERIMKERDLLRETGTDHTIKLEQELEDLRSHCDELTSAISRPAAGEADLKSERAEWQRARRQLESRLETQRLESIELATRLQGAQEQVRNLSATLAEARLQAKAASKGESAAKSPAYVAEPSATPRAVPEPAAAIVPPSTPAPVVVAQEPFPSAGTYELLRSMRRCYNAYAKDPDDFSHLNELHCAAFSFAEQSRTAGCVAVHRISGALATLVQELYHFPEQITSEVLTSIMQSIDFLTSMLKLRDVRNLRDPSSGLVCIVDDDAATRECLIMAMETVMLRTVDYQDPAKALCELTDTSFDLIVLDVQMPGMDGFELCSELRQRARHRDTPVVFVTGMTSAEMRARSTLCGGNDFMAKPFVLTELALKALMMIARTEMRTAV